MEQVVGPERIPTIVEALQGPHLEFVIEKYYHDG